MGDFGSQWNPTVPMGFVWGKASSPNGLMHVLRIESAVGVFGFAFDEPSMEAFIRKAQEQLTGLVIPVAEMPKDIR